MNVRRLFALVVLSLATAVSAFAASPNVVISQVYGAGGNSGANFRNDYIELFNRGTSPVTLTGWSVQYSSSTGTGLFSANTTLLTGTINPGQYYLVQESSNAAVGAVLPTPDASGGIAMAAGAGKVVLVNSTTGLACNGSSTPCNAAQLAQIVDLVGYGVGTNYFEGSGPTSTIAATTAAFRKAGGCTDTDNNANDFVVATAAPRNTSTTVPPCNVANNPPVINAPANPITSVLQNAAPFNVSLTGSDDNNIFNWSATPGTGVSSVVVASGQGTGSVSFTVTLVNGFTGTASFTASLSDNVNAVVTQQVNILVNAVPVNNPPTITPPANPITSVEQSAPPFTVALNGNDDNAVYNWSAVPGTGVSLVSVTAGQGTNHATFTVTLQGGFSGTATFTASLTDNVNAPVSQAVNITVTPPPPPANHIVISQVYGGGGNSGATYQNDYVELYNPTASPVEISGWSLQYQAAASTGNWSGLQPLGGTIGPGEYFLVSLASGGANGAPLPAANIVGGPAAINMSATAGKIALVSNGDTLSNCPFNLDPDLVDLVGYGTTANCREGSSNAPAGSNTTSLFRKNSGQTDTDVNGADFVAGAPNPRRTAPIVEIGPFVVTVDPNVNASTAPRDASITITFSEAVNVAGNWFDITCPSGQHNSATTAFTDGGATWVITPNVNFTPGEQCTVTLFAANITDVDTDDSGPNSDSLRPGNKVWSFTVATGAAPPYTPDVHLTFGNPSNAVADTNFPNNYLMSKPAYALSYNRDKGTPNWVSWHLTNEWYGTLTRVDTFRPDPQVPPDWYRVQAFDFFTTGFDRGHMTPNADRDNENRIPVNQETYLMSNMVPQAPDNNQGPWAALEGFLRTLTDAGNEIYIVSGPAGVGGTGSNGGVSTTIAGGHVTVPASTWKAALVMPKQSGDDVARVTPCTRTIAVIMPNVQGIRNDDWHNYLTTVDAIEALTGYNLFSNIPAAIQNAIESGIDGVNHPGAANQSVATSEDTPKSITLDAVSCLGGALNFTTTNPAHGTLSGSGNSRTYTPAPDFNGTDSFTYTASDASGTSNTATVNITVLEVNDPPTAANDSKSTDEDTPLSFPASDLTGNDSAGPANESAQTLTVTAVSATADTHGSVSLVSGSVSYSPDADYSGPASFSYHVCDNGTTGGLSAPLCADGTVNVTVNPVNDPPTAAADAKSTDEDTPLSFPASDLTANDSAGPANESQALTVTAVSATANTHGSVTLAAGQVNYVPDADYNGPASFSYHVCDDGGLCADGTVNVTVNPVNDPPAAAADSKSTNEDTPLNFPASDLTANDSAGPANESGQTLTVTAVSATADTHGTVSLSAGVVSYVPAANYNGPASFSYHVCDDGVSPLCADGTVNITVNAVNDPPSVSASAPSSSPEGTAVTATSSVTDPDTGDSASYSWTVTKNGSPYASGSGASITYTPDDNGTYVATVTVTDGSGATGSASATTNVTNVAPNTLTLSLSASSVDENGTVTVSGSFADPGSADTHTVTINWGDGSSTINLPLGSRSYTASHQYLDDAPSGTGSDAYTISVSVADDDGGAAGASTSVTVKNVAPQISSVDGPSAALAVGGSASITVHYSDVGTLDTHTATVDWGDTTTSPAVCAAGTCTASHTYNATGVYTVLVALADDDGGVASAAFHDVVVYDTLGGFVTGGGWVMAPAKSNFSLNPKYQHDDDAVPTGKVDFPQQGFSSTSLDWLVVSGATATVQGHGKINGVAGYAFRATAIDGKKAGDNIDHFRIKIWNETTNVVVYENSAAGADIVGGGNITIHK